MEAGEMVSQWYNPKKTQPTVTGFEDGREPWTQECGQPPEAEKGKGKDSPQHLQMECSPANTLMVAQETTSWDSALQNCKLINQGCFKHQVHG